MPTYEELKAELLSISKVLEGLPEAIKPQAYDLLVASFLGHTPSPSRSAGGSPAPAEAQTPAPAKRKGKPRPKAGKSGNGEGNSPVAKPSGKPRGESYKIDGDLNLRGNGSALPSFKVFYAEKSPSSAKEFNTAAVYYLQKLMGMDKVTLDHVYTCYHDVKRKPPDAFRQSFTDTKNKEHWLDFDGEGNLTIPHRGQSFVQHDLPKSPAVKK